MDPMEPRLSVHLASSSWLWNRDWPWRLGEVLTAISPGLRPRAVEVFPRLRPWTPQAAALAYDEDLSVAVRLAIPGTTMVVRARTDPDQWHGHLEITGPAAAARKPGLLRAVWALALLTCADYAHVHTLAPADLDGAPPGIVTLIGGLSVSGGHDLGDTGLPYLWWGNLLGASWTDLIGEDLIESTPAAAVHWIAPGMWWIQLTEDITDTVQRPAAVDAVRQRVVDHLGRDLFGTRQVPAARIPELPHPPDDPHTEAEFWDDVYVDIRTVDQDWVDRRERALQRLVVAESSRPDAPSEHGEQAGAGARPLGLPVLGRAAEPGPGHPVAWTSDAALPSAPETVEVHLDTTAPVDAAVIKGLLADLAAAAPTLTDHSIDLANGPTELNDATLARALAAGGARIGYGAVDVTVDLPDPAYALPHSVIGLSAGPDAVETFDALPTVVRRWAARLRPFYGQLAVDPTPPRDQDDDSEYDDTVVVDDLLAGLPDPAWAVVLGPAYTRLFGPHRLRTAPVAVVEELAPDVFWLQLTSDIQDAAARQDDVATARRALRRQLGETAFRGAARPRTPSRAALLSRPESPARDQF